MLAKDFSKPSRNSAFDALYCRLSALMQGYFQPQPTSSSTGSADTRQSNSISSPSAAVIENWPRRPAKSKPENDDQYTCFIFSSLTKRPIDTVLRKPPIINRGTYTRYYVINIFIKQFLEACIENDECPCQILCLGSGYDSMGMRLIHEYSSYRLSVFEVDYSETTLVKEAIVESYMDNLRSSRKEEVATSAGIKFIGHDLSDSAGLIPILLAQGFIPTVPTLILTECVLVYLEELHTSNLIAAFGEICSTAAWVSYDMVNPHDPFGKTMLANITASGKCQ
jgi:O-methyltransferase involved in polyketide biosynthesis